MLTKCDNCTHADFKSAAEARMKYWSLCKVGDDGYYAGRLTECRNNRFKQATQDLIQKRVAWIEKRGEQ